MNPQRIQLDDLIGDVQPYEPHLCRVPMETPDALSDQEYIHAAANTAKDILKRNGVGALEITDEDAVNAEATFTQYTNHLPITKPPVQKPATILKLEALVSEYDWRVINHADQIRYLVTNKLIEMSDHKDPRIQIKAVELLGKLADVGMFVEKQEVTYKQQSDADLQQKLREKLGLIIEGELVGSKVMSSEAINTQLMQAADPTITPLPDLPDITPESIQFLMNAGA